jgi:Peptidase family M28
MEPARPGGRRRRPRRGTVERPLNARLVRVAFVVVAPAFLALLFSISKTGTLPPPSLEPLFDSAAAASLASQLTTEHPSRVPGTFDAENAARWYEETIASFGFTTEEDLWREEIPDLGTVELRNFVTVVPGRSNEAIVVVAHRDNAGADRPLGDNASGTAALIELARGFAPQETAPAPRPRRTLVLVSTDGGAYGGAGAARFVAASPYADNAIAAIVLDGVGGQGRPRIAIAGDSPRSPAPALVRTAVVRVREQTGITPALPPVPTQLVDLGIPFAAGEQGRFLAKGIASITLTTSERSDPGVPVGDPNAALSVRRLGELGRATEALVGSIDAYVGAAFRTPDSVFFRDRVASGWATRLTLVVATVPFALGVLDLLVRIRNRRLPLAPAVRALRARVLLWLFAGLLLWVGATAGVFPTGAALPPPPYADSVADWPVAGILLLAAALMVGWLVGRRRLVPVSHPTAEDRLAGFAVALTWLAGVAFVVGLATPYALVFVLPSLYAWFWLPLQTALWTRIGLYVLGFAGPVGALLILAHELDLSVPDTALYVTGLASVGYVSLFSVLLVLAWGASAAQLGALAFGRYAPYAGGLEPPPPGFVRGGVAELARRAHRRTTRA